MQKSANQFVVNECGNLSELQNQLTGLSTIFCTQFFEQKPEFNVNKKEKFKTNKYIFHCYFGVFSQLSLFSPKASLSNTCSLTSRISSGDRRAWEPWHHSLPQRRNFRARRWRISVIRHRQHGSKIHYLRPPRACRFYGGGRWCDVTSVYSLLSPSRWCAWTHLGRQKMITARERYLIIGSASEANRFILLRDNEKFLFSLWPL